VATKSNSEKQNKLRVKQLIDEMSSGNQAKISASIKALQSHGDITILEPMVGLLLVDISDKTRADVIEFLSSLKDTDSVDEIVRILKDSTYLKVRLELLSTIWNSPLDYSYYLPEFVEIALEGNFMEALDCLTIIENMNGPFEERHILESKLHLKEYIEDKDPKDPQKAHIISEIAILIKDYDIIEDSEDDFFED
jgi:hypothetical protein